MKRTINPIIALLVAALCFLTLAACSSRQIDRGVWKNGVYYNEYGGFTIETNEYFDIYSDKEIKEDLGAVYLSDTVLNDMLISSDYCAVIVTVEKTDDSYSQSEYVQQMILNTRQKGINGTYAMADIFTQQIAGKDFTCIPVRYMVNADGTEMAYYEYDYVYKAANGYFVILRVTAGTEADIAAPLGMIKAYEP